MRNCAGTDEGRCVNTIFFHKTRIRRTRDSGCGRKKKSERPFSMRQLVNNPLPAEVAYLNFHPLEVVYHGRG